MHTDGDCLCRERIYLSDDNFDLYLKSQLKHILSHVLSIFT